MNRIATLALILFAFMLPAAAESGLNAVEFSDERLEALQEQGRPVLVDVYADWCPTCKQQKRVLGELFAEGGLDDIAVLQLDWDAQRDAARSMGAPRQSTLFLYVDGEQHGMLVAETNKDRLRAFLQTALN